MHDRRPTILIADDEPQMLEMLRCAFEAGGFWVCTARDGSSALDKALTESPDVLVLDMRMPGLTGWDVVHALCAADATRGTPVILMSGNPGEFNDQWSLRPTVKAVVAKPFSVEWLVELARSYVINHN